VYNNYEFIVVGIFENQLSDHFSLSANHGIPLCAFQPEFVL